MIRAISSRFPWSTGFVRACGHGVKPGIRVLRELRSGCWSTGRTRWAVVRKDGDRLGQDRRHGHGHRLAYPEQGHLFPGCAIRPKRAGYRSRPHGH